MVYHIYSFVNVGETDHVHSSRLSTDARKFGSPSLETLSLVSFCAPNIWCDTVSSSSDPPHYSQWSECNHGAFQAFSFVACRSQHQRCIVRLYQNSEIMPWTTSQLFTKINQCCTSHLLKKSLLCPLYLIKWSACDSTRRCHIRTVHTSLRIDSYKSAVLSLMYFSQSQILRSYVSNAAETIECLATLSERSQLFLSHCAVCDCSHCSQTIRLVIGHTRPQFSFWLREIFSRSSD